MEAEQGRAATAPESRSGPGRQALRLWLRMLTCTRFIEKRIQNLMRDADTTLPRFDALVALSRAPEGLTMGELSKRLLVSNGNVTGIISRLEAEALVSREALPEDKRTFVAKITPRGRGDLQRVIEPHEALVEAMFGALTEVEMQILLTLLEKLRGGLKRHDEVEG